ncbi:unnamed protein product [Larinioides sclopetarius]|uniref:Uncharacterized protein n=1 Tax=Larinioides sclopetarius TaxID=280406 RepID=A0AAV2BF82_9ARAC
MKEEELSACYAKLICEMGKVDEFYEVATLAEPETGQEYANFLSQVFGVENPENTLEFWIKSTNTYCGLPEEQQKKAFNDWCTLVGEHMLKVCRDPTSEICVKSDLAADQFAGLLSKYKAIGFCTDMSDVPKEMTPKGLGKMASPFG